MMMIWSSFACRKNRMIEFAVELLNVFTKTKCTTVKICGVIKIKKDTFFDAL